LDDLDTATEQLTARDRSYVAVFVRGERSLGQRHKSLRVALAAREFNRSVAKPTLVLHLCH
jgi:hypothetical protein